MSNKARDQLLDLIDENDLSSDAAKNVQRELRDLGLPTLPDIEEDVDRKAKELGI